MRTKWHNFTPLDNMSSCVCVCVSYLSYVDGYKSVCEVQGALFFFLAHSLPNSWRLNYEQMFYVQTRKTAILHTLTHTPLHTQVIWVIWLTDDSVVTLSVRPYATTSKLHNRFASVHTEAVQLIYHWFTEWWAFSALQQIGHYAKYRTHFSFSLSHQIFQNWNYSRCPN